MCSKSTSGFEFRLQRTFSKRLTRTRPDVAREAVDGSFEDVAFTTSHAGVLACAVLGGADDYGQCLWFSSSLVFLRQHCPAVLLLAVPVLVLPGNSDPDRAEDDQTECEGSNEERPRSPAARWL